MCWPLDEFLKLLLLGKLVCVLTCVCVCVCVYVCVCVCVCVCACVRVGLASQQWGFTMHTHHSMHKVVLAPGPG